MHSDLNLPIELYDIIIDNLWDDQLALSACSLVCYAWLPTARLHKLRTVVLRTPERYERLRSVLLSPLVQNASIPLYVRELELGANPNDKTHDHFEVGDFWHNLGLVPLLCKFSKVENLHLNNLKWSFLPDEARRFTAAFPQLKRLAMKVAVFHSPEDLLLLLSSFPRLTSAAMAFVSWCDQDVVTRWTTAPSRPPKESTEPKFISLHNWRTDPTSYIAVISAAAVSRNTWRLALDELEWVGHEKFASDWMLARAYEQSTAFVNPLSEITAHLFAVEGRGMLESRPPLVSRLDALRVDIASMPGPQAWTSVRVIPFHVLDIREICYALGTVRACSIFHQLGERLAWMYLDRFLAGLLEDHPQLLSKFQLAVDFDGEAADYAGCMAVVEDSFNHNLSSLLERGARMCLTVTYPTGKLGGPEAHRQEIWWPRPSVDGATLQTCAR
ncbi:hypothetical protein DAEQUDRAFT_736179 [Daedalea quercina L-15889]|uniref:F-box domain-containing protein n=1 Tax=Daedalea quercina L-15889 TaxID=1314783 RepID=A0A165SRZ6_9APHY|nr:hypothetical protein DAEQUDRAFT_736179 [Daedalea quercina L-15889]